MLAQTKNILQELKMTGVLKTLDLRLHEANSQGWGHIEFLSSLVTDEKLERDTHNIQRKIKAASFRIQASFEQVDFTAKRTLTKTLVKDLMQLEFIKSSPRNIVIVGPTGVGKTYLASAIGHQACRHGHSCTFIGISVLCEKLLMTRADGSYLRLRDRLIKTDLLIIDDMGLKKLPAEIVQDLHDLLEERQCKCTIITTQLPLKNWNEIIEDELALDTIVDKLHHGSLQIILEGESYRKKKSQRQKLDKHSEPLEIANQ